MAAPRFFSGAIQLGELMQISSAFGRVQDSLAWFVDNYSSLAAWRATTDRLTGFEESIASQERMQPELSVVAGQELAADGLSIGLPGGATLLAGLSLRAAAGDAILIKGPSGSGKSTLFRAFAGIWPFAKGKITAPQDMMCIPQNPYFPDGPLRDALAYPEPAARYDDRQLKEALVLALLPQLADRLDDQDAWTQKLSGGERQRLAIARVLLKQPRWLLVDQGTASLDAESEKKLYERLLALVQRAQGALISIAHRPAIEAFHTRRWELVPAAAGEPAAWRLAQS